jgi:hypothetical protein
MVLYKFKNFLSRQGGTVVVDRTFNLGHFFVTTFAYKSHPVVKDTKDPPIFCPAYMYSG